MRAAGLEEVRFRVVPPPPALPPLPSLLLQVATVLKTQCVLISNPHSEQTELIELVRRRIAGYMTASRYVMITYNVHRAALKEATVVTPGKRSPSIVSLEESNWVAVNALVEKTKVAGVMDELERIGATDILTTQLHSSRMGD
ncbi:MAG: hypothetical protein SGPRY_013802 [Prymnesium sp.]